MWVFGQDTLLRGGEVLQVALRSPTVYRHKLKSRDMNTGGARFPFSVCWLQTTMAAGSAPELSCSH